MNLSDQTINMFSYALANSNAIHADTERVTYLRHVHPLQIGQWIAYMVTHLTDLIVCDQHPTVFIGYSATENNTQITLQLWHNGTTYLRFEPCAQKPGMLP